MTASHALSQLSYAPEISNKQTKNYAIITDKSSYGIKSLTKRCKTDKRLSVLHLFEFKQVIFLREYLLYFRVRVLQNEKFSAIRALWVPQKFADT
jgi:hypothetical protein